MITSEQIAAIREDYTLKEFNEKDLIKNPFEQFKQWFHEAISAEVNEPNAMTLATTNFSGRPAARIVLLKGINEHGLKKQFVQRVYQKN
jgi:pyridoxamine 5'-phosphate oxidase